MEKTIRGVSGLGGIPRLSEAGYNLLKWSALLTMVTDHVGMLLLPDLLELRFIGRLAWPLFAFLLAYNVAAGRFSPDRYISRLLPWAMLAQVPFVLAVGWRGNILFTLLLAVVVLSSRNRLHIGAALVAGLFVDYGVVGVLLPYLMVRTLTAEDPKAGYRWAAAVVVGVMLSNLSAAWPVALAGLLAAALCRFADRLPAVTLPRLQGRWVYAFYPVHLLAIVGAATFLPI